MSHYRTPFPDDSITAARRLSRRRFAAGAAALAGAALLPGHVPGGGRRAAVAQQIAPVAKLYFAGTGHNLADPFLSAWHDLGGETVLGPPLSEERYAEGAGGVLQTFANFTLVYDPTESAPTQVRIQPLDEALVTALAPASALSRVTGCAALDGACRHFAETGHTISGRIAEYWQAAGGARLFGLPLSEPFFDDTGVTAQLFQHAILEDSGIGGVRPRPAGRLLVEQGGLAADPAFKPAPPSGGTTYLVEASDGLRLRGGPGEDAAVVMVLPDNAEFIAAGTGDWVPGYADGFAGWVSSHYLTQPPPLPPLDPAKWRPEIWQGAALGETNVRSEPSTKGRIVAELDFGDPITVSDWVEGEEVFEGADLWAKVGEGRFIYARNVGRNAPVLPIAPPPDGADLGQVGRYPPNTAIDDRLRRDDAGPHHRRHDRHGGLGDAAGVVLHPQPGRQRDDDERRDRGRPPLQAGGRALHPVLHRPRPCASLRLVADAGDDRPAGLARLHQHAAGGLPVHVGLGRDRHADSSSPLSGTVGACQIVNRGAVRSILTGVEFTGAAVYDEVGTLQAGPAGCKGRTPQ